MISKIERRLRRESFLTTPLAILINPFYLIRRGLYVAIRAQAPDLRGRVLDLGCGSKPYRSLFTGVTDYVGVDLAASGHDHRHSSVDVFYDGRRLPFRDGQFDAAVSFEVLEHVFEPERFLAELRRVLRPGGELLLSVPFAWDEHEAPYDYARYTSYGLRYLLGKQGFEVVSLNKTTSYVRAVCQMWIAYLVQHVMPKRAPFKQLAQLALIAPLTLLSLCLDKLLPRSDAYFCNSLVRARRMDELS